MKQQTQKKEHIIQSEMLSKDGVWKPKAKDIAMDADKVFKRFIEKHKGELSLCSLHSIMDCSVNHQIMMARLHSIKF